MGTESAAGNVVFVVPADGTGAALGAMVRQATGRAWTASKDLVTSGRVRVDDRVVRDPGARVTAGQAVTIAAHGRRDDTNALPRDAWVHLDPHFVVVDKPSGVSTVPFEEGERGALVDRVRVGLHRGGKDSANAPLFVVHRIDKETSGLVVFARSWLGKRHLGHLFREHDVERVYVALVNGHLPRDRTTFDTHLVENRGDGLRGSAKQSGLGVRAVTHVEVLARFDEAPVTLVRCQLETGRTHQIRVHLAEVGHPLVGERVYSRHFTGPQLTAPRLMLHAAVLGFSHPAHTTEHVRYLRDPPADFTTLMAGLGGSLERLREALEPEAPTRNTQR